MSTAKIIQKQVLQLYCNCLKAARKCPKYEHQEMMKIYVQMKFQDNKNIKDSGKIQQLLKYGQDELDRMNYYHSLQAAKMQQKKKDAILPNNATNLEERCSNCNYMFQGNGKFCSECGVMRQRII